MAPELVKVAKTLGAKVRVAKIDSDLASRLKVSALPTILLFRGGEEVGRVEGAMMAAQLIKFVEAYAV
jgi:thioredoxin 2